MVRSGSAETGVRKVIFELENSKQRKSRIGCARLYSIGKYRKPRVDDRR